MIGNGDKINLWLDNWLGASLVSIMNIDPKNSSKHFNLCMVLRNLMIGLPPFGELVSLPLIPLCYGGLHIRSCALTNTYSLVAAL